MKRRDIGGARRLWIDLNECCPTVMGGGIGSVNRSQYRLDYDTLKKKEIEMDKPIYKVPSVEEINKIPWNGYNVISTFSGCGGSSLGYKMAGFKVLWANEFIPAAQEVYRLNHKNTILDCRDIRIIQPEEILKEINMEVGELDVFDGSPPCASFSMAGNREKDWGKVKKYSDTEQRTDDLFFEYARLIKGVMPKIFVAENVKGLTIGTAKDVLGNSQTDMFGKHENTIYHTLVNCGYNVAFKVLNAANLGVPQARQRCIIIGIRNDLKLSPEFPKSLPYQYSVRDALPWIKKVEAANGFNSRGLGCHKMEEVNLMPCIQASRPVKVEAECDISRYAIGKEWEKMGAPGTQSTKYFQLVRPALDEPCGSITQRGGGHGATGICHPTEKRTFSIAELKRICAFPDDFILTGTYAQQWERLGRAVPPVMMMHIARCVLNVLRKV